MTLVSIVIPAYNARRWIEETLDSVLAQELRDSETILVDDGSTDGTSEFVAERYPWVIIHRTPNQGASAARNLGTDSAQGEFIQYLDADDVLPVGSVATRLQALQDIDADVAYSNWQRLTQTKEGTFVAGEIVTNTTEYFDPDPQIAAFTDFWCPPVALLYRRRIVEKIGRWNERLPIIQDARFLLDAALNGGRFVHVPQVGGFYREHNGGSLSRRSSLEFVRDCFTNALEVEQWWLEHGGVNEAWRLALVKVFSGIARASHDLDAKLFDQTCVELERLEPGFIPRLPTHLRLTSKIVGYRSAEKVAANYRWAKQRLLG